jgi:hypothetical protein
LEDNVFLNQEELQAVQEGRPVPVVLGSTECVVVRKDVFERVQSLLDDSLDADTVGALVERNMAEDDANDPLLDAYQKFK